MARGLEIGLRVDLKGLHQGLTAVEKNQLPFAMAKALTATAGRAGFAWQDEMAANLDRPTPFTLNSVSVIGARKSNLRATVFIRDIAAEYLEPFVDGGVHSLGAKRGLLTPKDIRTNAYGNLPKTALATLKGRANTFIGKVEMKDGQIINGVWERVQLNSKGKVRRGPGANRGSVYSQAHGRLKLLIRFNDPMVVKQHLDFRGATLVSVRKWFSIEFIRAFAKAMATAK